MAYDAHKNFAFSQVAVAPSPATSGTSLTVVAGDGAKFPAASFNAVVWPVNTQPTTTNAEVVRVTVVSTDTFTITRTQEGTSARTIVVGDQISNNITLKTIYDIEGGTNGLFDYVISGCVWTGDSLGSTRNASMTAGTIWLNNAQLSVAAITAHIFTASKDTYVDFSDNGDGTAVANYTEALNNVASPALTAGRLRNAIIVTGASAIAAAGSINQGQETLVLPIASSIPYTVTDSLGNLICPRDPTRRTLGYRQITVGFTNAANTSVQQITGLTCPVIVPANRKVEVEVWAYGGGTNTAAQLAVLSIWDGVVVSGTQLSASALENSVGANTIPGIVEALTTPATTSKTYNAGLKSNVAADAAFIFADPTYPAYIKVRLA